MFVYATPQVICFAGAEEPKTMADPNYKKAPAEALPPKTAEERAAFWKEEALRAEARENEAIKRAADLAEQNAKLESLVDPKNLSDEELVNRFNNDPESIGLNPPLDDSGVVRRKTPPVHEPLDHEAMKEMDDDEAYKYFLEKKARTWL